MNQTSPNIERVKELLGNKQAKAIFVAVLILVVIAVLQVNNLNKCQPMCDLLSGCQLRSIDLHRIQIALSKAGLSEFKLVDGGIQVPESRQAEYLLAIAEQDAIPQDLRASEIESSTANPFLSRSQQLSMQRASKKRLIQQMVERLPFVDQAWFEMDAPDVRSAFQTAQKAAVISIRPAHDIPLMDHHIDTVRQMIGGAVAGIEPSSIAVIDLSTGFAHRHSAEHPHSDHAIIAQRVAFARQQLLETRIRNALQNYPGLVITVAVEDLPEPEQTARKLDNTTPNAGKWVLRARAGANGQASIGDIPAPEPEIQLVTANIPTVDQATRAVNRQRVLISIQVPGELVEKIYGAANQDRSLTTRSDVYKDIPVEDATTKFFNHLKSDLTRTIQSVVAADQDFELADIQFSLTPSNDRSSSWSDQLQAFANENWPSIAVLLIGLMLISLITQTDKALTDWDDRPHPEADVVSFETAPQSEPSGSKKREAEVRLSRLIEKDPDAAAKVIESWIRDAA